jgi:hypothetical protein
MDHVKRSDGRTLSVGDTVASPEFNGRGIIKSIDHTRLGVQVTVSFNDIRDDEHYFPNDLSPNPP